MKQQPITVAMLAMKNIRRKPWRSFILISFLLLFSFALFSGTMLSLGLANGIRSLSDRLGADVMAVPEGYDAHIDSILLSSEPNNFFLPADTMEKLQTMDEIEKMTPQVYLATLKASCCSYPIQLVGIDFDTDFIIKPWLTEDMKEKLKDGEIIVGYRVNGIVGEELHFFNRPYAIAGRLAQTGMAFDTTVFMNRNTIVKLAKEAERITRHPLSEDNSLVSTVMIKLKPGEESVAVAKKITDCFAGEGIFGVFSKKFVNEVSSNLTVVSTYLRGVLLVFWVLAVVVIGLLFQMSFQERKKELAVLRAMGATKRKLFALVLLEAMIVGMAASGLGTLLAGLAILIAGPNVSRSLTIPFLLPKPEIVLGIGLLCFGAGVLSAILSSFFSAFQITKTEIYQNLRENE